MTTLTDAVKTFQNDVTNAVENFNSIGTLNSPITIIGLDHLDLKTEFGKVICDKVREIALNKIEKIGTSPAYLTAKPFIKEMQIIGIYVNGVITVMVKVGKDKKLTEDHEFEAEFKLAKKLEKLYFTNPIKDTFRIDLTNEKIIMTKSNNSDNPKINVLSYEYNLNRILKLFEMKKFKVAMKLAKKLPPIAIKEFGGTAIQTYYAIFIFGVSMVNYAENSDITNEQKKSLFEGALGIFESSYKTANHKLLGKNSPIEKDYKNAIKHTKAEIAKLGK